MVRIINVNNNLINNIKIVGRVKKLIAIDLNKYISIKMIDKVILM